LRFLAGLAVSAAGGLRLAASSSSLLALDDLLNLLAEFAVVHDSKIDRLLG